MKIEHLFWCFPNVTFIHIYITRYYHCMENLDSFFIILSLHGIVCSLIWSIGTNVGGTASNMTTIVNTTSHGDAYCAEFPYQGAGGVRWCCVGGLDHECWFTVWDCDKNCWPPTSRHWSFGSKVYFDITRFCTQTIEMIIRSNFLMLMFLLTKISSTCNL